ncbi:MAG: RNA 2'-phosphotransferase [Corynebacterium sp.]|nr:RNA 2'-phosphotransferase [Corynebacterium sp.]
MNNAVLLSKEMSRALRHTPQQYGLTLDAQGWVPLDSLIAAFRRIPRWRTISESDIHAAMTNSNKQRFEIAGGRIRALYGHSVAKRIEKQSATPPSTLYHGTSQTNAQSISQTGLRPMGRQYVHLSEDLSTATIVGRRKRDSLVVFQVDTSAASRSGVKFYYGNDTTWLADAIPAEFLTIVSAN